VEERFAELKRRLAEIDDLHMAARLAAWDQQVTMPPGGAAARAEQLATLNRIAHEKFVDEAVGRLLEELGPWEASLARDSDEASLIRVSRQDWQKATRVPAELAAEQARVHSESMQAWAVARANADYAAFRPWLDRVLEVKHRYIACFESAADPYDIVLDDFERDMPTADVRRLFGRLKPVLTELAAAATDEVQSWEAGPWPRDPQYAISLEVIRAFGADERSFRLDPTVHPFCTNFSTNDVRLTTRYGEKSFHGTSLFSTIHEAGHGLYEHGVSPTLERTPLRSGCSSALHESQSRLWENVIGRSLPFWRWLGPRMESHFPGVLAGVGAERMHRAANRVRRSHIRVDADEITYGLHVILRFELEQQLLFGGLSTAHLPDAWNTAFEETLGLAVPDDAHGCLQDVHWSLGLFGYFPTYQIGNVLSVQIWDRLLAGVPDADERIEGGDFAAIHAWLRDNLYVLGRKFTPSETIERVVGGPIDPEPYIGYLRGKVAALG